MKNHAPRKPIVGLTTRAIAVNANEPDDQRDLRQHIHQGEWTRQSVVQHERMRPERQLQSTASPSAPDSEGTSTLELRR